MNIYDLPIPNFGELSNEQALELILEVRSRRRKRVVANERRPEGPQVSEPRNIKSKIIPNRRAKKFNTPFGKFTKEELQELLANLK